MGNTPKDWQRIKQWAPGMKSQSKDGGKCFPGLTMEFFLTRPKNPKSQGKQREGIKT